MLWIIKCSAARGRSKWLVFVISTNILLYSLEWHLVLKPVRAKLWCASLTGVPNSLSPGNSDRKEVQIISMWCHWLSGINNPYCEVLVFVIIILNWLLLPKFVVVAFIQWNWSAKQVLWEKWGYISLHLFKDFIYVSSIYFPIRKLAFF
jgi:hypothetical protein